MVQRILKIATAGSVDDGKSTLLARLLLDSDSLPSDLRPKDTKPGTLANLLDGLDLERQQGITIDVAHRYFDQGAVRFHLMDSPGHQQYTRNMATAASGADVLLLLISANEGVKPQSLNHLRVAKLVGIKRFIIAVNKLDLVRNRQATMGSIRSEIEASFDFSDVSAHFIGVIATTGENVVKASPKLAFQDDRSLLEVLQDLATETSSESDSVGSQGVKVSIQEVVRRKTRTYLGEVFAGQFTENAELYIAGTNLKCTVKNLLVSGRKASAAKLGDQVAFELVEDRDIARGDLLMDSKTEKHSTFIGNLVWLDSTPGYLKRRYTIQVGHQRASCRISKIKSISQEAADSSSNSGELPTNSISRVEIVSTSPLALENTDSALGKFILIDTETANTCAAGTVSQIQRRSQNLFEHDYQADSRKVAARLGHHGKVIWLTGLSGSGKSTIADALARLLARNNRIFSILDGDSLRQGLNRDLGFTEADRVENIRRVAEVSKILVDSGLVTIVSLVSPFRADRDDAREIVGSADFIEVFVDTPIEICEGRDPKGLYKKARAGQLPNFTGIDSPYEPPETPEIHIHTTGLSPEQAAERIMTYLINQR